METKTFNWWVWVGAVFRWLSAITIFYFTAKIGMVYGIFDNPTAKAMALVGFCGYIVHGGVYLVNYNSTTFWVYRNEKEGD